MFGTKLENSEISIGRTAAWAVTVQYDTLCLSHDTYSIL